MGPMQWGVWLTTGVLCRGAYRCFCVELQPQFLLLDAVLQADDLAEAEGGLALHAHGGRSLSALRSLLLAWATDASCRCVAHLIACLT